jgi:hypothetical protein
LAEHFRRGTLDTAVFKRDFAHQVTALSEATEIMRIHKGLASLYSSGLRDKLQTVLSGKDGRPSPADFDPSRDTAFELLLASRCQGAGLRVEIGIGADLIIPLDGAEVFVECKRLKSPDNVRKRIKQGLKQLHRRYESATAPLAARGILALSITDLANPEHGLITGNSPEDVSEKVHRHVYGFILRQQFLWQHTQDRRTIGAFVELFAPSIIENENLFTTCHQFGVNNSCPQGTPDMSLLLRLARALVEQSV